MNVEEKESLMTDHAFCEIAKIAIQDAGLSIPSSKKALVQSRIARRLRVIGLTSFDDYIALLKDASNKFERKELISILTTNVSSFYRENHHFEHLVDLVFPRIREKISRGESVRIWSAGCSGGQEPYTICMETLKNLTTDEAKKVLILATDIDPIILEKARLGRYSVSEVSGLEQSDKNQFFYPDGEYHQVKDELKSMVRFRELNLHGDWPMKGFFDAIFCRNVLIYFDEGHQQALWPRFHNSLNSNGILYLGHSERIHPIDTSGFESIGATIYRKAT